MNTLLKLLALFPNNELPEDNHYDFYELASNPCIGTDYIERHINTHFHEDDNINLGLYIIKFKFDL